MNKVQDRIIGHHMSSGEHYGHNLNLNIDLFGLKPGAISPSK